MCLIQWAKSISSAILHTLYVITKALMLQTHHGRQVLPYRSKTIKELWKIRQDNRTKSPSIKTKSLDYKKDPGCYQVLTAG